MFLLSNLTSFYVIGTSKQFAVNSHGFSVPAHKDEKPDFSQAPNILIHNNWKVEMSGDKNININGIYPINGILQQQMKLKIALTHKQNLKSQKAMLKKLNF